MLFIPFFVEVFNIVAKLKVLAFNPVSEVGALSLIGYGISVFFFRSQASSVVYKCCFVVKIFFVDCYILPDFQLAWGD